MSLADKRATEEKVSDQDLVLLSQNGDGDAFAGLCIRYMPYLKAIVRSFHVPESDFEDLLQEGLIGLYKAVMSYDIERGSFKSFLSVCASRSMLSALRRMEKEEAVSMETENTPVNNLVDLRQEPEQILFSREEINQLQGRIRQRLSKLELRIFTMYLAGKSYDAIAKEVGKTIKSVDNAIARAKKKVNYMPR